MEGVETSALNEAQLLAVQTDLGIKKNADDLAAEIARATGAEEVINNNITSVTEAETARATEAEEQLQDNINAEKSRAETAESDLQNDVNDISTLIPAQATADNQLADKDFVNSTVGTNTAIFRGTFNSLEELEAYEGEKTNNDYAFVITEDLGTKAYNRYKYDGNSWEYEYTLNNSSFTAEQWNAINSGITAEAVEKIGASGSSPIGAIIPYTGTTAPAGFLLCDGAEYDKTDFEDLYNVIGDTFSTAETTAGYFNVPDLRARFMEGADGNNGEYIAAGLPNITGGFGATAYSEYYSQNGAFTKASELSAGSMSSSNKRSSWDFDASKSNPIYGASDTVQPPALAVNFIIKATRTKENLDEIIDDTKQDNGHSWSAAKILEYIGGHVLGYDTPIVGWIKGHTSAATAVTATRDGILTMSFYTGSYFRFYENGVNISVAESRTTDVFTCPIKKGNTYYYTGATDVYNNNFYPFKMRQDVTPERYGTHYVEGEVDTGKTWIDGKPIYRNIIKNVSWTNNQWTTGIFSKLDVNTIDIFTDVIGFAENGRCVKSMQINKTEGLYATASTTTVGIVQVEYTKTTD